MLIHSVWEIGAISVLFFLASSALRGTTANVRYIVALVALCACVIGPMTTFFILKPPSVQIRTVSAVSQPTSKIHSHEQSAQLVVARVSLAPQVQGIGKQVDPY